MKSKSFNQNIPKHPIKFLQIFLRVRRKIEGIIRFQKKPIKLGEYKLNINVK